VRFKKMPETRTGFRVFLGFYIKEVKLDKLEGLNSSLKAAQYNSLLNSRTQEIRDDIQSIRSFLLTSENDHTALDIVRDEYHTMQDSSDRYLAVQDDFANSVAFMKALPDIPPNLSGEEKSLNARIAGITKTQQEMLQKQSNTDLESIKSQALIIHAPGYEDLQRSASQFIKASTQFNNDAVKFTEEVDKEAKSQYEDIREQSERANQLNKILFVVGWAVGLAGKLLKLPALGGSGND
jgi:hypothetical protein